MTMTDAPHSSPPHPYPLPWGRGSVSGEEFSLHLTEADQLVASHGLEAIWHWEPKGEGEGEGHDVWLEVANVGAEDVALDRLDVLAVRADEGDACDLGAPPRSWSFYQHGWQSWTPTFVRSLDEDAGGYTPPQTPEYRRKHRPHSDQNADQPGLLNSEWVTVISAPGAESQALLLGFVTLADQLGEIRLELAGDDFAALTARCHLDGAILRPGERLRSERLWVRTGPDPLALLEDWAGRAGREMEARLPADPPTGWCSWYYFYGENTAQEVLDNVDFITEQALGLDVILIDDGYQTAIGDWLSLDGEKFPAGMEAATRAIGRAGRQVGIWTAPFGAAADSRLFAAHPDWFLRDANGEPVLGWVHWGVECYALDCTHPDALSWLHEIFEHMRSRWGVELFKIDFIFSAARPGRRHDPTATRAQALRRGVRAIREAIGDDAFLLGCGAPLGPCVGLVDGMRIGPDVDPNWYPIWRNDLSAVSTRNALCNGITRAPLHGRLWANDPDCVLVRQRGDSMDLTLNEVRTLATLVALLGGLTLDSDHLPQVQAGRIEYLRQTLPPTGTSARPLDLFERQMPRTLLLPVERDWGRWWVAGLVNWDDRTVETTVRASLDLPPGRYHVYNYWRRRYLGVFEETVTIRRHQPHETAVLLLKPVSERPDLLTTTFHICQGAVEIADCELQIADCKSQIADSGVRIRTVLEKTGRQFGRVLFTLPQGWRVADAYVAGRPQTAVTEAPGVISFGLTLEGRAVVEVAFERIAPP